MLTKARGYPGGSRVVRGLRRAAGPLAIAVLLSCQPPAAPQPTTGPVNTDGIVVTRDDPTFPPSCRPLAVGERVVAFLTAFNLGDRSALRGYFGSRFQWYSMTQGDPRGDGDQFTAYDVPGALKYLVARHAERERLTLRVLDVGYELARDLANVSYVLERVARDISVGSEGFRSVIGKGAISCLDATIVVWSMAMEKEGTQVALGGICPLPIPGPRVIAVCARES
jgi:hypothetical protein